MRNRFDKELIKMHEDLISMAALVETAISRAVEALKKYDADLARITMAGDKEVDQKEREIESTCLKLLLQQQPVARDLREISTALKMITDMERIGDLAEDIAEVTLFLCDKPSYVAPEQLSYMAEATIKMVRDSIDAFVTHDLAAAHAVIEYDDVVDKLFADTRAVLVERIHESLEDAEQAMDIMMIAKYFERIGDHAVNISEWVEFSITGTHKQTRVLG
ncbi:phosphate signaling complex protein PhoU [Butyricicoccus sp.]|uniref:phosphate signaling complex protein PhoU n=1 Tax=Butyricicoccus sp. TaxID=2049021 RepID=UPI003735A734